MGKKNKDDLGLVVVSKDEAFWMKCEKETKMAVLGMKNRLRFEEAALEMIREHLKAAQAAEKRNMPGVA